MDTPEDLLADAGARYGESGDKRGHDTEERKRLRRSRIAAAAEVDGALERVLGTRDLAQRQLLPSRLARRRRCRPDPCHFDSSSTNSSARSLPSKVQARPQLRLRARRWACLRPRPPLAMTAG